MLGDRIALKGCAARTGKPASALDRDAAAKRFAIMPNGEMGAGAEYRLTALPLM